jgi:branched-chain amino acid transport system ATP-binding protein
VLIDGEDVTLKEPHLVARRGVALVPGGAGVFPSLTVAENLSAAGWQARRSGGTANLEQVLDHFPRLRDRLGTEAGNLSGGEQQMLAVAQAFLVRPRLLLIDELSMGLAPQVTQTILDELRRLRDEGTAIVIVEQSLNVSMTIADRAVLLEKGEVRYTGPARELLDHPELFQSISFGAGGVGAAGGSEVARRRKAFGEATQTALEVTGVRASYGGVVAVRDVTMQLQAGEVVGLIGPNGAGKTTLFDVISGFHRPDAGTVAVLGADVTGLAPYARARRGLMRSFQNVRLFPSMTVRDNIATALERHIKWKESIYHGLWLPMGREGERKAQARVDMLIELLELGPYVDRTMGEISIGTRRIVDIACQLAARPRVLLLDEPSSGLAQVETEQLGPIIARIAGDLDAGILVIEHDIPLISAIASRLIALDLGSVIAEGAPHEVLSNDRVKEAYFGGAAGAVVARSGRGDALPA